MTPNPLGRIRTASAPSENPVHALGVARSAWTIPELVARSAALWPAGIVLLGSDRPPLSYQALLALLEHTREALHRLGIGRNHRVAVVGPDGPELAAAFLGVSSCAAYAPLNPLLTLNEYLAALTDVAANVLIMPRGFASPAGAAARTLGLPVLELVSRPDQPGGVFDLHGEPRGEPVEWTDTAPEDVALLLTTSGTTARPKLVALSHRQLCLSATNIRTALQLSAGDRCLNIMPFFHVHGLIGALLPSLAAGASVVCTPGFDAPYFLSWLETFQPTWYTAVPTMHQAILARAATHPERPGRHTLRFIRSGSAALPPAVGRQLEQVFGVPVIEAYGMTETANQICCNPLPPLARKPGSVGLPTGTEVGIMDTAGAQLPALARGEVVVRGPTVMSGYASPPEANHHLFTDGWFRTGDEGYLDHEGYLYLTGRLKELINRAGEKIAPREIEEALLAHPAVAQAVAFGAPDPQLGETVAAAVVLRTEGQITERELRGFVAQRLSYFKLPTRLLLLTELPTGPTGKVGRIGLAERLGLSIPGDHDERGFERSQHVQPTHL